MSTNKNRAQIVLSCLFCAYCLPGAARAHGLHVFATGEGDRVTGRAYFTLRSPVKFAKVELRTPAGRVVQVGKTDANGRFNFKVKKRLAYTVVVTTVDGHRGEFTIDPRDLELPGAPAAAGKPGDATALPACSVPANRAAGDTGRQPEERGQPEAMRRMLREMLARQREQLDAFIHEERLRDALAGVGYIMGLAGIAFYFLGARRREQRP